LTIFTFVELEYELPQPNWPSNP